MSEAGKDRDSVGITRHELDLSGINPGVFRQQSSYQQREPLADYGFGGSRHLPQERPDAVLAKVADLSNLVVNISQSGLVKKETTLAAGAFDDPLITIIPDGGVRVYESLRKQKRGGAHSTDFQPVVNAANQIEWHCLRGYPQITGDIVAVLAQESQPGGILHEKTIEEISKTVMDGLLDK